MTTNKEPCEKAGLPGRKICDFRHTEYLRQREDRLAAITAAKKRLEQRQAEEDKTKGRKPRDGKKSAEGGRDYKRTFGVPDDKAQENFTDPDSRILKGSGGYVQEYRKIAPLF